MLAAFDPDEVTRLYASAEFAHAVDELADPDAVVNAVLAIHQARCGGVDSILDTAAALPSQDMAAAEGVGTYEYFEQLYSCLRNISLLPNPDSFKTLSPSEKEFLHISNDRIVKFICMIKASAETHVARRQIEASMHDSRVLVALPFPQFVAKLVSQLALAPAGSDRAPGSGSDRAPGSDRASRGATALGAQARPPRRDVKDITCFNCRVKGHFQRDCPSAPGAGAASLSVAELAVFRRMMAAETAEPAVSAAARAGPFPFLDDDEEEDDDNA